MIDGRNTRTARAAVWVLNGLMATTLVVLALAVFIQVVMRYMLSAPPFWTEELARFMLIWLTFIGIASVQLKNEQIGVDWIAPLLPPGGQLILRLVNNLVVLVILGAIVWAGFAIAALGSQTSPALGIHMYFIYGALPVGAIATMLVVIAQMAQDLFMLLRGVKSDGR
ncbi:TRAP transporter small permease [Paracoccus sp. Z330]|uniref:TRAP transporter small permease protein n=1 Tax=Paracoccus onchidii TaxID=3017813 RepID=A0ABT4ZHE4_9RHOB|nr:TRAP transporter small permease [Paracoccus onchidii]MDB6178403.1 TRAP transporter small permease [Paracoccus onchidii]